MGDVALLMKPVAVPAVTPAMIQAGRRAFLKERKNLDDLYDFFDDDLDRFLTTIFTAMRRVS